MSIFVKSRDSQIIWDQTVQTPGRITLEMSFCTNQFKKMSAEEETKYRWLNISQPVDQNHTNMVNCFSLPFFVTDSDGKIHKGEWVIGDNYITINSDILLIRDNMITNHIYPDGNLGPGGPMGPRGPMNMMGPPAAMNLNGNGPGGPMNMMGPPGEININGPGGPIGPRGPRGPRHEFMEDMHKRLFPGSPIPPRAMGPKIPLLCCTMFNVKSFEIAFKSGEKFSHLYSNYHNAITTGAQLGMISHKKSQITIFGHKYKIKNFIKL